MRLISTIAGLAIGVALTGSASTQITFLNYTSSSSDTRIGFQRIGVTRGATNFAYWDTDVIMPSLNRINGVDNVTVVAPAGPIQDANAFLRDNYLNTGFETPGVGNGTSFGPSDQWTQVTFDRPIVNGMGPDGFVATLLFLWVTPNYTPLRLSTSAGHTVNLPTSGGFEGPTTFQPYQYTYLTPVTTPADLTNFTPNISGALIDPSWVVQTFDLSSMGVPAGASITTLYLQAFANSGGAFPTFIAGFPAVPEPASAVLLSLCAACLGAAGRKRVRSR